MGETLSQDGGIGVLGLATTEDSVAVIGTADEAEGRLGHSASNPFGLPITQTGVWARALTANARALHASGNFSATGTKNFVQPHPTDPTKEIHFTALEGDEAGTYFRASGELVGGYAEVEVPEAFRLVSEEADLSAHLTPVGGRAALWIVSQDLERIVVAGDADVAFHLQVHGIRRGFADHRTIQPNRSYVPERRGVPFGAQYPDDLRRVLVENGILNPDFTPNEATAGRIGWRLTDRDPIEALKETRVARTRRRRSAASRKRSGRAR